MNRTLPLITGTALLLATSLAFLLDAHAGKQGEPSAEIRQLISAQAQQSDNGVILALSHRGTQAAEAAYLLACNPVTILVMRRYYWYRKSHRCGDS